MKKRFLLIAICLVFVLAASVKSPLDAAQVTATVATVGGPLSTPPASGAAVEVNPNVIITSPVLVSELHGLVQVMGTANLPGMRSYFLEIRELNADASVPGDDEPWTPASLPVRTSVQNAPLEAWDTTQIPDGLYELRLTVTADNALSVHFVVTPLRINNTATGATGALPTLTATAQAAGGISDSSPQVTANLTANVRMGDSIYYPIMGDLARGATAPVLGISSTGSGWYYIQLPNGQKGWISPIVVTTSGDFSGLTPVKPPPPPAVPLITSTPVPSTTLRLTGIALSTGTPVCGQTFNVQVNIANFGSFVSPASTVVAQDVHVGTGTVTASNTGSVPSLNPGANFVVTIPLTTSMYYNEAHQVQVNLNDNQITASYTLAQGACNLSPTPTSKPTVTRTPGPTKTPGPSRTPKPSSTPKPSNTPVTPTTAATAP